jgi:hypothetical protein
MTWGKGEIGNMGLACFPEGTERAIVICEKQSYDDNDNSHDDNCPGREFVMTEVEKAYKVFARRIREIMSEAEKECEELLLERYAIGTMILDNDSNDGSDYYIGPTT